MNDDLRNSDMNISMFVSFCKFIVDNDGALEAFKEETGVKAPTTPIDYMVDKATGKLDDDCIKFLEWIAQKHWGWGAAPDYIKEKICNRSLEQK